MKWFSGHYMKDSKMLSFNATIKQLQRMILLKTAKHYMNESNILSGNVTIKQL